MNSVNAGKLDATPLPRYEEGQSLNNIWVVKSLGIDPATGQEIETEEYAAFYNTETETTTVVEDYGEATGMHVTDDGIAFIGIGTMFITEGKVYDLNTGTDLGNMADWVAENYGIIIPGGVIEYISADGRYIFGTSVNALGSGFDDWYIAPPLQ